MTSAALASRTRLLAAGTMFELDPHVKRGCIVHGPIYRKASALVDHRNNFVWLATTRDEEPVMLTQHLSETDSMLASIADPQRAPEMLAVREAVRGWRFYDHFRTDFDSAARAAQIGIGLPDRLKLDAAVHIEFRVKRFMDNNDLE